MLRFLICATLSAAPLFSQQTTPATYETGRKVTLQGPVTRIEWTNPRAYVFLNVKDTAGVVTTWAVEIGNPLDLEKNGWKADSLKVGDVVTVAGTPSRTPARALAASVTRNGTRLFTASGKAAVHPAPAPAPRWPNGHVRLGPAPGGKGYWGAPSATTLVETGVTVPISRDGLLMNLSDAGKVAPMQPWAQAAFEYRQRTLLRDDPYSRCLPPGGPRQFQMANGFQFIEQPELGRILVLLGGGDRNWRVIYTDGRPAAQGDDLVLTYYGTSVGHWEKDTLVVDSVGFNERFWMSNNGLPNTEALHLTERFSRPDLNTLKYEVTVNDPRTYTRPWSSGWTVAWVPDREIQEYFCEENAEQSFVR
jgi:hypothetical protein